MGGRRKKDICKQWHSGTLSINSMASPLRPGYTFLHHKDAGWQGNSRARSELQQVLQVYRLVQKGLAKAYSRTISVSRAWYITIITLHVCCTSWTFPILSWASLSKKASLGPPAFVLMYPAARSFDSWPTQDSNLHRAVTSSGARGKLLYGRVYLAVANDWAVMVGLLMSARKVLKHQNYST